MPAAWNTDRRRSRAQADFWNPTASSSTPPLRRRSDGRSLTSIRTPAPRGALEQVAGQDRLGLRPQKLAPRWSGPPRCRVDAGGVQDSPDGGGADLVAEVGELAWMRLYLYPQVGFSVARR